MANNSPLRIGFDARLAGSAHAGIGRYSENLIRELIKLSLQDQDIANKLIFFFFDQKQAREVLGEAYQSENIEVIITPIRHYGLQEQLQLPKYYRQARLDILYVPHWNVPLRYHGKLIITIHDLLWHEQKGTQATTLKAWQYLVKYLAYRLICKNAIKKAQAIFVPAQTIKDTVLRFYPFAKHKVLVSKEGIAKIYEQTGTNLPEKTTRIKNQLVYTGSLYPHKNLKLIIQSLKKLPKYKLLIVSARNIFQDQIQALIAKYKVKNQVEMLGFVPDDKLIKLYHESTALVQPSLSEGFGLTGVEAMACRTPVLASDIPVFREIYQDAAFFFDPHSPASFITALQKLEDSNRKSVVTRGLKVAKQYSFATMASDIWQKLCKRKSP